MLSNVWLPLLCGAKAIVNIMPLSSRTRLFQLDVSVSHSWVPFFGVLSARIFNVRGTLLCILCYVHATISMLTNVSFFRCLSFALNQNDTGPIPVAKFIAMYYTYSLRVVLCFEFIKRVKRRNKKKQPPWTLICVTSENKSQFSIHSIYHTKKKIIYEYFSSQFLTRSLKSNEFDASNVDSVYTQKKMKWTMFKNRYTAKKIMWYAKATTCTPVRYHL